VGIVAWKELRELFRDLRSVALTVLVPLLLFPFLFLILDENVDVQRRIREEQRIVVIAVGYELSPVERTALAGYELLEAASLREAVLRGEALLAIDAAGRILYNERSETSTVVAAELGGKLTAGGAPPTVGGAAPAAGGAPPADAGRAPAGAPPLLGVHGDETPAALGGATFVALLVMLAALISPLPAALELGAGEKQRQSLEFLLLTTGRRGSLFLGKLLAVWATGVLGVAAFVCGVLIAQRLVPGLFRTAMTLPVREFGALLPAALLALLLTALLSAVELVVSVYARSPREAQSLFLPLLLLIAGVSYVTVLSDAWFLPAWYRWVPVLNVGLLLKALLLDVPGPFGGTGVGTTIATVVVENSAVLVVSVIIGRSLLRSERVIRRS